jgi:hypothetical protein
MIMKVCTHCSSSTFDDMPVCYGCLRPFDEEQPPTAFLWPGPVDIADENDDDLLTIEEPSEVFSPLGSRASLLRFHVTVPDLFGYDIYLETIEQAQLTVGCARDNNIVLPHTESRRHLLRIFYAQGQAWVEDRGSTQCALVDGTPLTGTRCLKQGVVLEMGTARIELVEE